MEGKRSSAPQLNIKLRFQGVLSATTWPTVMNRSLTGLHRALALGAKIFAISSPHTEATVRSVSQITELTKPQTVVNIVDSLSAVSPGRPATHGPLAYQRARRTFN